MSSQAESEDDPEATMIVRRSPAATAPAAAPPPPAASPPVAPPEQPVVTIAPAEAAILEQPAEALPVAPGAPAPSPMATLAAHPERFDLDQAAFVIARERDAVDLPFASVARLGLPLAEVTAADPKTGALTSPLFGLIGPGGTLPRHYTSTTGAELRNRSRALHAFLDMLARRFTGMWVRAGAKYRPARDSGPARRALDAAIGMGTPGLSGRLAVPAESLRYHAGHLAARTRSAERLRAMLAEEAGAEVEIVEFAGGWLRLPVTEQSRVGVVHGRLGVDAAVGAQVWDPQARFIIRLGPLDAESFARLLPGQPLFEQICGLTRLFVGPEQDFVLNPILAADAVPATRAGTGSDGGRLGLTSWMGASKPRRAPARDAYLRPSGI
ncbi:type VI secretion system baseplate subunit TssG [Roseococcus sp. SYP-B2431]|uniref:type VI secretion system baseplate subunit TssG n=1 Tax=Roseococcus sp. SYP-B2431 TaxID=2496640 RepID=UPI00103CDDA1|nr:type VI secretion system baseplate subunit TssG [Roseococcus sp. SYP-B2431]TCH99469.1 type VI secretion system baseplate subunit TssG [Roseococcus sp. SYP-B2431]